MISVYDKAAMNYVIIVTGRREENQKSAGADIEINSFNCLFEIVTYFDRHNSSGIYLNFFPFFGLRIPSFKYFCV
jgi:hypothetical protein